MADPNRPEDIATAAVKFDGDKSRWDLLPFDALEEVAKLYTKGAKKYDERNWEKGFRWGRTFAAMSRHAIAWFMAYVKGEDGIDPETGLSHMVAVVWNALALVTFELRRIGVDDRPGAPKPVPIGVENVSPISSVTPWGGVVTVHPIAPGVQVYRTVPTVTSYPAGPNAFDVNTTLPLPGTVCPPVVEHTLVEMTAPAGTPCK